MRVHLFARFPRLKEVTGLLLLIAAIALLLALASYSSTDPSWNNSTWRWPAHNRIGRVGSHISDLSFQLFGLGAWLLPLLVGMLGWCWIRSRELSSPLTRVAGYTMMALSLSGGLTLLRVPNPHDDAFSAGGSLGYVTASSLSALLNTAGAALTLLALFMLSLYLVSKFSMSRFSAGLENGIAAGLERWARLRHRVGRAAPLAAGAAPVGPAAQPGAPQYKTRAASAASGGYVLSPTGLAADTAAMEAPVITEFPPAESPYPYAPSPVARAAAAPAPAAPPAPADVPPWDAAIPIHALVEE